MRGRGRPCSFCVCVNGKKMNGSQLAQYLGLSYSFLYSTWKVLFDSFTDQEVLNSLLCKCGKKGTNPKCGCAQKEKAYMISSFSGEKCRKPKWAGDLLLKDDLPIVVDIPDVVTVPKETVNQRVASGWSIEDAIAYPPSVLTSEYLDVKNTSQVLRPNFQADDKPTENLSQNKLLELLGIAEKLIAEFKVLLSNNHGAQLVKGEVK